MKRLVNATKGAKEVKSKFIKRIKESKLTRNENPKSHFCVYFAIYDPKNKQVFIGHHKKSDLWLFNGGHIDKGESALEALNREIREEFGRGIKVDDIDRPHLLTLTKINNFPEQGCKWHYDIWYFISLNKNCFAPDENLLAKEFYQTGWKTLTEAKDLIKDVNTLTALGEIRNLFS